MSLFCQEVSLFLTTNTLLNINKNTQNIGWLISFIQELLAVLTGNKSGIIRNVKFHNVYSKGHKLPGLGLGFLPLPLFFGTESSVVLGLVSLLSGTSLLPFRALFLVLATKRAGDGSAPAKKNTANKKNIYPPSQYAYNTHLFKARS